MRFIRPVAVFCALFLVPHGVAWACSCVGISTTEAFDGSDLVVVGEVVSVRQPLSLGCSVSSIDPVNVSIEVHEAFTGAEVGDIVNIQTARSGASCGVAFEEGEVWLVFGSGGSASLCGGSKRTPNEADLDLLADLVGD